jgi:uncharacterized Zn finger protein
MLEDIIVECPCCGHPIDSHIKQLDCIIRCPECDNLWTLVYEDIIQPRESGTRLYSSDEIGSFDDDFEWEK